MSKKKQRPSATKARKASAPSRTPLPKATRTTTAVAPARAPWIILAASLIVLSAAAAYYFMSGVSPPTAKAPPVPDATFVGATACTTCHAKQGDAWRGSDHDLAMQVADAKSVLGDFAGTKFAATTFFTRDGKYFVNTEGPNGKPDDFEIKYTFGVRPLQQYLIELPGGRMQAFGIAWDSRPKEGGGQRWFHLNPDRTLKAGDPQHWTGIDQNWNFQCAECHSTNLRKNFDPATMTFKTTWSELNVACESCHGPASNHVAWARKAPGANDYPGKGLSVSLDERRGVTWNAGTPTAHRSAPRTTSREIETCARCHARAARFTDAYVDGAPLGDSHRPALLTASLYATDGQMREEVYNWGSFLQSKMHAQGVNCSDCHDPHSLELRAPGNAVCAQCHAPASFDEPSHTHHAKGTPGAACAACHMPTTTYMILDPRHDHSLRIPRPDLSVKLGVPNACNGCHAKQSPQWAAEAIAQWTGGKAPGGYQRFADAFAAGTSGAPGARGMLLTLIDDPAQPAIVRASALERLGAWLTPATTANVSRSLNDADPIVRAAAVNALANEDAQTRQRYLPRMLSDPVRIVRMDAAQALAGPPESSLAPEARAAFAKALDEYIAAQAYNADRPEGHMNLANLYGRRNDAERAIAEYRKAIAIDPSFFPAYVNLADSYRARDVEGEAERVLREGLARNPDAAVLHHSLGLALVRQKRQAEALPSLATAYRLAPDNPRYAFVYAVGLDSARQPERALLLLDAALKRHPHDRDLLEALAQYAARDGRQDAAVTYAKRLRDLDPENQDYARLVQQYEAKR